MLRQQSRFFQHVMFIHDVVAVAGAWITAFVLRFYVPIIPVTKGIPPALPYAILLVVVCHIWGFVFRGMGLYRPGEPTTSLREVGDVAKASSLAFLLLLGVSFFYRDFEFSRAMFALFWGLSILCVIMGRIRFRRWLAKAHARGDYVRSALIVGTGEHARRVTDALRRHPELGIRLAGAVGPAMPGQGGDAWEIRILGDYVELRRFIRELNVSQVYFALPAGTQEQLEGMLRGLDDEVVDVLVIPDVSRHVTLRGGIEELDGLPFLGLQQSPLSGWNVVLKRGMDIVISSAALVFFSPVMLLITAVIRLTSPGPMVYRQERVGLDGQVFPMLKFRTMQVDAEATTGPVWARQGDPRRTAVGAFLRKTSLDELPQLWNVLKGDMSLVGPRPERPVFIEEFRKRIPRYMLRHKVKAGVTGWAQVNGWRGDTDLDKRIEYDLTYIENWSLLFDLKILLLTIVRGFLHKHAY